jgi:hypothetical protein
MKMRGLWIGSTVVSAILLLPCSVLAQTDSRVTAGIVGGFSITNIGFESTDVTASFDRRYGAAAGGFVGGDFGENLGIRIEGLWVRKGTKTDAISFDPGDPPVAYDIEVDYVEIPVLARASVTASTSATARFFAGPAVSFRVRQVEKIDGATIPEGSGATLKRYDLSVVVGAGIDVRRVGFEFRYTHGLTNTNEDEPDDLSIKNRTICVLVNVRLK